MPTKPHEYRVGTHVASFDSIPTNAADLDAFIQEARKRIEPWLSAVFQAEHLNALIGSGFTTGIAVMAGKPPAGMGPKDFGSTYGKQINAYNQDAVKQGSLPCSSAWFYSG